MQRKPWLRSTCRIRNNGHAEQNLPCVSATLMMPAFLMDRIQEACCGMFRQAREARKRKLPELSVVKGWTTLWLAVAQSWSRSGSRRSCPEPQAADPRPEALGSGTTGARRRECGFTSPPRGREMQFSRIHIEVFDDAGQIEPGPSKTRMRRRTLWEGRLRIAADPVRKRMPAQPGRAFSGDRCGCPATCGTVSRKAVPSLFRGRAREPLDIGVRLFAGSCLCA